MDMSFILHKGHITHVIDPSSFWMRIGTDAHFQEFEEYQNTLDKFYNETGRKDGVSVGSLVQGDCVMVADTGQGEITVAFNDENNTDFHWNRAKVSRVDGDKVDVFYIDLGYTEIVKMSNVKNVNQELFDFFPTQVIQLGIAGIRPLARSWTSRAITMFESKVLNQEVLVSLIDYDEANKYGQVLIYLRCNDNTWHCLTHEMLEEELGLPTELIPEEYLNEEIVLEGLKRAEQESSLHSLGNNSYGDDGIEETGDDGIEEAGNDVISQEQDMYKPESEHPGLPKDSFHHPFPADFTLPSLPGYTSQECESSSVGVPAFDLNSLKPTMLLSLSKMQEDKTKEQHQHMRAKLEREVQDCQEDEDHSEFEWGKTDLQIGQADAFADFDNRIRHEIYKNSPLESSQDDLHEFFHNTEAIHREEPAVVPSVIQEQKQSSQRNLKPLTERDDYDIQKKVEGILLGKENGEPEMVCVLINSIIEPDIDVPCDRLRAVFTAILETLIRDLDLDPLTGFCALETYLETAAFEEAIEAVLKSLRHNFVKNVRNFNYHRAYVEILAELFIRAKSWPVSYPIIRAFVMASLENWTVFNKQRIQDHESCVTLEQIFLECVETFIDIAWETLKQQFPQRCSALVEEIKLKLLHDQTHRNVRVQLLNILLKLHTRVPSSSKSQPCRRDIAIQTEDRMGSSMRESQDTNRKHLTANHHLNTRNGSEFGKPSHCDDLKSAYYFPSEDTDTDLHFLEDIDDFDVNLTSQMHSLGSVPGRHAQDSYRNLSSASSIQYETAASGISHNEQKGNHNKQLPESVNKYSPQLQKKFFENNGLPESCTTRQDQSGGKEQQKRPSGLNMNAPEFIFRSSSRTTVQQVGKTVCLSAVPGCESLNNVDPISSDSSQETDTCALRSVQLNLGLGMDKEKNLSTREPEEGDICYIGKTPDKSLDEIEDTCGSRDELFVSVPFTGVEKSLSEQQQQITEDAVRSSRNANRTGTIRYTSKELRALNTRSSACLSKDTRKKPREVDLEVHKTKIRPKIDDYEADELKRIPFLRYTGSGDSPLEISEGPNSNSSKWKSLSELLPASLLKSGQTSFSTSVDPVHVGSKVGQDEQEASKRSKPVSLRDIAADLITTEDKQSAGTDFVSPGENDKDFHELSDEVKSGEEINFYGNNYLETSDAKDTNKIELPEMFFKGVEPLQEEDTKSVNFGVHTSQSNTKSTGLNNKKKKIKFRPASEVLAQTSSFHDDIDQVAVSQVNVNFHGSRSENPDLEVESIIHPPKVGAISVSSNWRLQQLSASRQDKPKSEGWVPGKRKCTWCGSEDHIIYDCALGDPMRKADV